MHTLGKVKEYQYRYRVDCNLLYDDLDWGVGTHEARPGVIQFSSALLISFDNGRCSSFGAIRTCALIVCAVDLNKLMLL